MSFFNFKKNPDNYYNKIINIKEKNNFSYEKAYADQEKVLYKLYGDVSCLNKKIKIIVISDTHNSLNVDEFKSFMGEHSDYDVCLLLGDYGYNDLNVILKYIDKDKTYALLGNHDHNYIKEYELNDLNGKIVEINGVRLLGIQGSFRYKPSDFPSFSQKESISFLETKQEADILVSHDSKFRSEEYRNPAHQGLFGITYYLYKNKVPYHIHGHLHESYKNTMLNGTKEISVYMFEYIEI